MKAIHMKITIFGKFSHEEKMYKGKSVLKMEKGYYLENSFNSSHQKELPIPSKGKGTFHNCKAERIDTRTDEYFSNSENKYLSALHARPWASNLITQPWQKP